MNKLLLDNFNNEKIDFSYIRKNGFLTDPEQLKLLAIRGAKGSSFLEGINLPENFFKCSYESIESNLN